MQLRLSVVSTHRKSKHTYAECLCTCGNTKTVRLDTIGKTIFSCGCLRSEMMKVRGARTGKLARKHGDGGQGRQRAPEYRAWAHMKNRCFNPNNKEFHYWGGRGITVCPQRKDSYEAFLADVGRKPIGKYSLDRINVDGNYEPGNVRWATDFEQANNKRKYVTLFHVN